MGKFNLKHIWKEIDEVFKVMIMCGFLTIGAMALGCTAFLWISSPNDNSLEDVLESKPEINKDADKNRTVLIRHSD